jgi:hypothetical protein
MALRGRDEVEKGRTMKKIWGKKKVFEKTSKQLKI